MIRSDLAEIFKITSDMYGISKDEFFSLMMTAGEPGEAIPKSY